MKVATLTVEGDLSARLSLRLSYDTGSHESGDVPAGEAGESVRRQTGTGADVLRLVPTGILRALRQWYHQVHRSGTLAVVSLSPPLDAIPWERLPDASGMFDLAVVRLLPEGSGVPDETPGTGLLAAGWTGAPTMSLPGIQTELAGFSKLTFPSPGALRVMAEPSIADLRHAWTTDRPRCLHIAGPFITYEPDGPRLAISGTDDLEFVPLDALIAGMEGLGTRLVSLNLCDTASAPGSHASAARLIAERLGVTTVGWYGQVEDSEAADFATYFYSRMLDGDTVSEGLRRFTRLRTIAPSRDRPSRGIVSTVAATVAAFDRVQSVPVLWMPAVAALGLRPLADLSDGDAAKRVRRRRPVGERPEVAPGPETQPTVSVDFEPQRWLNPALLKNRRSAILRLVLDADRPLQAVSVSIACDTGAGHSTVAMTLDLSRGPQPVAVDDLHFPVLYQLMEQATGRRWVNFTFRCTHGDRVLAETTRAVLWMGRSEWLDRKDMWHFIPAFVDPNAEGVLKVLDEANVLLKRLDPTSSFDGYQRNDPSYVRRQVEAIFCCLRDDPFELSYINVPPLEVYLPDETMPTGQQVRTPTQVIDRRRGTCHDLAVLVASCLEHVGIHPLVVLKPGHTFTGYWTDLAAWERFWRSARVDPVRIHQESGRFWVIGSVDELTTLIERGDVALLEATCVTDRNARFEDALSKGRAHLTGSGGLDVAVDVRASRGSILPV